MIHRTTFALDAETVRRLKALAALKSYHAASRLDASRADSYLAQARVDRKRWRR